MATGLVHWAHKLSNTLLLSTWPLLPCSGERIEHSRIMQETYEVSVQIAAAPKDVMPFHDMP